MTSQHDLENKIEELKNKKNNLENALFDLQEEIYLTHLTQDPHLHESYRKEDDAFLNKALSFKSTFNWSTKTFFGYPGNLTTDSPMVHRLRQLEAEMVYINNAGDPYEQGDFSLDGKAFERELLQLFYRKFEMDETTSWGYVTSCGSESNLWGILNGFRKFPQGRLYFCEAAHYSVLKAVVNGEKELYPFTIIPQKSASSESINIDCLIKTICHNWIERKETPILLLTWGTTQFGSCDDIKVVTQKLNDLVIPYYAHVDAAFYGGIPNNQINAPSCPSLKDMGADSVSVSFHKFFGVPNINSVVLSKTKGDGRYISYLGQHDTTVLGSRTFSIFSALWRIKETLERSPSDFFIKNIAYFENQLLQHHLKFFRDEHSSIFVIPLPSKTILSKYQLASFMDQTKSIPLAHIIINPFHTFSEMKELIDDLSHEQGTSSSKWIFK